MSSAIVSCLCAVVLSSLVAAVAAVGAQDATRTIWDGVFSESQAARGERAYQESCGRCHADDLLGTPNGPPLVGEAFFARFNRVTADDVVQTVRRTMPQEAPDSLGTEAYVAIATYLFKANGSPAGAADLPVDRAALQQVLVTSRQGESR